MGSQNLVVEINMHHYHGNKVYVRIVGTDKIKTGYIIRGGPDLNRCVIQCDDKDVLLGDEISFITKSPFQKEG